MLQRLRFIIFQVHIDAKSCSQWCREQSASGGSTYQRKGVQIYLYGACRGPLVYHNVYTIVFHGRIEILLHHGRQSVYLIDKQHIIPVKRGENTRQVTRFVEHGSAGDFKSHSQFVGNDIAQCGFSQSGRSVQQGMV